MGQANSRRAAFFAAHPQCIFCGGTALATTEDHCPPRALFRNRQWPEGFVFPACEGCNGGSSNDDLLVAFLALMGGATTQPTAQSIGTMRSVNRQFPSQLGRMLARSPIQARADARRLGLYPRPGQTYQDVAPVSITPEMTQAVKSLAGKLTKAIFYERTGEIFPLDGGLRFQWVTNADRLEDARVAAVNALSSFALGQVPITRAGRPLNDQFDYRYSSDDTGRLHVLSVKFGEVFGFVTVFSQESGLLEAMHQRVIAQVGNRPGADFLEWLSRAPEPSR